MRQIEADLIKKAVKNLCLEANFYLRKDVLEALKKASQSEESLLGKDILQIIIKNAELAAEKKLPLCQDTGSTSVFLEIGQEVNIVGQSLEEAVNEGVRQGYKQGFLRNSMVNDPLFRRENTADNTPALVYSEVVPGDNLRIRVMPKGAGCDNVSRLKMLKPGDGVAGVKKFILETVKNANGRACPPLVVGVGIGGSFEMAPLLAKKSLFRKLGEPHPDQKVSRLEEELLNEINRLGIGPMGIGGTVTALGVAIEITASHIASLPVAADISCHSLRSAETKL